MGIAGPQEIGVKRVAGRVPRAPCAWPPPAPGPTPGRRTPAARVRAATARERYFPRSCPGRAGPAAESSAVSDMFAHITTIRNSINHMILLKKIMSPASQPTTSSDKTSPGSGKKLSDRGTVIADRHLFRAVASVSQGGGKTLERGRLSPAKQHLPWRHFAGSPL